MNVIFFDIDGVLNYYQSRGLDWDIVDNLIKLAQETDSKLVMSSSWKDVLINPDRNSEPDKKYIQNLLNTMGELYIGYTPETPKDERELEVQEWLDNHPDVNNFVIFDDLDYRFEEFFGERFIKTSGFNKNGLTKENIQQAKIILKGNNI